MTKQPIPISRIVAANKLGRFNALWVWVKLKEAYKHKPFITLNYSDIQNTLGISHTTLRLRVKELAQLGMVNIEAGVLHLTGIDRLKSHDKEKCVLVPVESHKAKQILQFRKTIVHQNIKNQEKQIKLKSATVKNCSKAHGQLSKKQLRLIAKAGGVKKYAASLIDVTTLSNNKIGFLFKLSQQTGHRIQKALRGANLIQTKTRLKLIKDNSCKMDATYLNREGGGYIYNVINGRLYRRMSNAISVVVQ